MELHNRAMEMSSVKYDLCDVGLYVCMYVMNNALNSKMQKSPDIIKIIIKYNKAR